jgi:HJR/Mrr/RecB family endonuclease
MTSRLLAGLCTAALLAGAAQAQTAAASHASAAAPVAASPMAAAEANSRAACKHSALTLCNDQISAGKKAIRACLIENFDKVEPKCQEAMKAQHTTETAAGAAPATPRP